MQTRIRFVSLLAAAVVLAGAVSGCSGSTKQEAPSGSNSAPAPVAQPTPAPKAPIKIGVFGPLSGSLSIAGTHQKEGAQFAVDEINAAGGVNGYKFELLSADTEGVPANTTNVMNKFLYNDNVTVTMGSPNSPEVLAVLDLIKKAETPHVTPSGVAMAITHSNNPWVFRVTATDEVFSKKLVDYALDQLKLKKIAIIYDTSDYGQGGMTLVKAAMKAKGVDPVVAEGYNANTKDFTSQLLKFKNAGAEGIIIWGLYTEGAQIARQVKSLGLNVKVLASTGVTIGNFYELAGDAAEGLVGVTGGFHPDRTDKAAKEFMAKYKTKLNYVPDLNAVLGYDAVKVIAKAVEMAGSADKKKIRDALASIKDLQTISGPITVNKNGDGGTAANIFIVKSGKPTLVQ